MFFSFVIVVAVIAAVDVDVSLENPRRDILKGFFQPLFNLDEFHFFTCDRFFKLFIGLALASSPLRLHPPLLTFCHVLSFAYICSRDLVTNFGPCDLVINFVTPDFGANFRTSSLLVSIRHRTKSNGHLR